MRALAKYGVVLEPEERAVFKKGFTGDRNLVVHAAKMSAKKDRDHQRDIGRIAHLRTLLTALVGRAVGYDGAITGWQKPHRTWRVTAPGGCLTLSSQVGLTVECDALTARDSICVRYPCRSCPAERTATARAGRRCCGAPSPDHFDYLSTGLAHPSDHVSAITMFKLLADNGHRARRGGPGASRREGKLEVR